MILRWCLAFSAVAAVCASLNRTTLSHKSKLYWMREAVSFIEKIQNNCDSKEYIQIKMGINGGFSAQFQLMASEFARALAASNFMIPIHVYGTINGYSEGEECKHVNYEWTCFFLPASKCTKQLLSEGKERNAGHLPPIDQSVPSRFRHLGTAFWWGAVQRYLFKLQPFVEEHIAHEAKFVMHPSFEFPFGLPIAGMHVRKGDKHIDGFVTHSFEEELSLVRQSPDCEVMNSRQECFINVLLNDTRTVEPLVGFYGSSNGSNHVSLHNRALYIISSALSRKTVILRRSDIDKFNYSSSNEEIAVNPKKLLLLLRHHSLHNQHHFSRGSSISEIAHGNGTLASEAMMNEKQQQSRSNAKSLSPEELSLLHDTYVIPLAIYVASDDANVLHTASKHGYFTDATGVSQQTASNGMFKTLLSHHEFGFNATLEIITDIYFLAHSSTLLGMAASQVFRTAVALSNVTNTLHHAKATDMNQIARIKMLSLKYDVPFVENFQ